MKKPDKFILEVQSIQSTLEALDEIRDAFEKRQKEDGLTKKTYAEWLDKDPSFVSRILNGRVTNVNYKTISQMLVALDFLPKLTAIDCRAPQDIPNYIHGDAVEDHYVRSSKGYKIVEENPEGDIVARKGLFRQKLSHNA